LKITIKHAQTEIGFVSHCRYSCFSTCRHLSHHLFFYRLLSLHKHPF